MHLFQICNFFVDIFCESLIFDMIKRYKKIDIPCYCIYFSSQNQRQNYLFLIKIKNSLIKKRLMKKIVEINLNYYFLNLKNNFIA